MKRRDFIAQLVVPFIGLSGLSEINSYRLFESCDSEFAKKLKPIGRVLELKDFYVWGTSPIQGEDGKIHLFFSRWKKDKGMGGWLNGSEICRAVGDKPEGPFRFQEVIIKPQKGLFYATTCHNPTIKRIDGKFYLFFIGCQNGKTNSNRIGMASAESINGPWRVFNKPILEPGPEGSWDDHNTSNPSLVKHPNGSYWLYYKSWNTLEYENGVGSIKGNRKYGLAISDKIEGPYIKLKENPLIDFSEKGNNAQLEDAYVWIENNRFKMVARDMGYYNHVDGIYMESEDGIVWEKPLIAYHGTDYYEIKQPPPPKYLNKYGRFERPQILFMDDKPSYLYVCSQGGKFMTASTFIFKIT